MILEPNPIKTIDPYCRILTFNNFDLNSTDLVDLLIKERRSKCLPVTINLQDGDVSGSIYYDNYSRNITNLNFLIRNLKNLDYVEYELTAQDANSKNYNLTGRVRALHIAMHLLK